jgi:hypothetical protein
VVYTGLRSDSIKNHASRYIAKHTFTFSLYTWQCYMSYRFADSLLAGCQQTCMTYTIAVCAVKNSWWWIERHCPNM